MKYKVTKKLLEQISNLMVGWDYYDYRENGGRMLSRVWCTGYFTCIEITKDDYNTWNMSFLDCNNNEIFTHVLPNSFDFSILDKAETL